MTLRYGSVCSGIEAATVAWEPLGWKPEFFSEISAFPRDVLAHHYPAVPLHGDFTTIEPGQYGPIDLLVGGTPCQDFSIAGLRAGMDGDRGNLTLEYLRLAQRLRPRWLVWENVPGVLSANGGRAFGSILGALEELGYGWAYRILDAQHFGVPQRRRRVFLVAYLGDWRRAGAVLFERESLSRNPPPKREEGDVAPTLFASGAGTNRPAGVGSESQFCIVSPSLTSSGAGVSRVKGAARSDDVEWVDCVVAAGEQLAAEAVLAPLTTRPYNDRGSDESLVAFSYKDSGGDAGFVAPTMRSLNHNKSHANAAGHLAIAGRSWVRRLTPRECERLQGFPDDYTLVPYRGKPASDTVRYRALGNTMAVPCMRWIGRRIQHVESEFNNG